MQVFDHDVQLLSKVVVEPRDTKGKAARSLRMVRRSQLCRGITCFLGARNRISEAEVEQRGDSPVLVMHDGVTEKVVKMIVKDLDTALLRAVKLAWTGYVVQETSAEGDPQPNGAAESSVNVVKGHVRSIKLAVESASGVEVPANRDLLTWLVSYATSMRRRFSVGRDGKTAFERNAGRRAVHPLAQFGERVWWMPLQPSNRRLGPLDSRFEQGRYLGPMDGSITVLVGTASGVVKARTIKRLPPGERWTVSLLDEAQGSEVTPNALEDDGGRVGIRAPVLQPHAAVSRPPLCLNVDKCDERHCAELTLSS